MPPVVTLAFVKGVREKAITVEDMEPGAADMTAKAFKRRMPWRLTGIATLLMLGTVALIWLAAVPMGTGVCPAIDPPPTGCLASYRAGSGLVATVVLVAVWAVTTAIALIWAHAARAFVVAGIVILAVAPFVSYAAVAWSPGFALAATAPSPPTDDPVGQWGTIAERSAYLTILGDGKVAGSDGCNGMGGTWSLSDGVVTFSDMVMTLMMCPARDSDLKGPVDSAIAKGDRLYVLDADGNVSGVLQRVSDD